MPRINDYFKNKIINMNEESKDALLPVAKRAAHLTEIGISNDDELVKYLFLEREAGKMNVTITDRIASEIIKNSSDTGDILYGLLKRKISDRQLKKIAYPNPGLSVDSLNKEVDLNEWLELVHKIYKACKRGEMTKQKALDFYSNNLDNEEKQRFLRWFEYYSSGQHLQYPAIKHSDYKGKEMKKESVFQSGLIGSGFYDQDNNRPGSSFGGGEPSANGGSADLSAKEKLTAWKKAINRACKRIDTLLREGDIPYDSYSQMAKHLFDLSSLIKQVKMASTMSDVTHRTANILKQAGHQEPANILIKIAQEISEENAVPAEGQPAAAEVPESTQPEAAPVETGPSQQEQKSGVEVPEPDAVEPTKLRDIEPIPGPQPGEYEALAGNINLEDAAKKLDDVAGMLADRRIIRQLAEFDIMLDKIGIASMFPELAESQSKLIDAFSYALTRVTKMMGQLSNAKTLLEAGGPLPGTGASAAIEAPEAAPEAAPEEVAGQPPTE